MSTDIPQRTATSACDHTEGGDAVRAKGKSADRGSAALRARHAGSERVWASLRGAPERFGAVPVVVTVILVVAMGAAIAGKWRPAASPVDCGAALPGSNWDFCSKAGLFAEERDLSTLSARNTRLTGARFAGADLTRADLSYADLTAVDLTLADLRRARLLGAGLRRANLNHAHLDGADLRFADLTGAQIVGTQWSRVQLGHAIWVDGRSCARGSVGECREMPSVD